MAAAVAALFAFSGCGGSGESEAETTPRPTKAEFLKKGNAICAAGTAKINKRFEKYSRTHLSGGRTVSDKAYAEAMARIVLPAVTEEVRRIRALGAPAGDGARVRAILAAFEEGVAEGRQDPLTLPGTHGSYAFERPHELAVAYGLDSCT